MSGASSGAAASAPSASHQPVTPPPSSPSSVAASAVNAAAISAAGGVVRGSPSQYVKLNVGGWLYYTTIGTLTKHDSMLRAMFSGRMEVLTDAEGEVDVLKSCNKTVLHLCTL